MKASVNTYIRGAFNPMSANSALCELCHDVLLAALYFRALGGLVACNKINMKSRSLTVQ